MDFNLEGPADFVRLRKMLGLTQAEMANRMALSPRTYFSLEEDHQAINLRHIRLAEVVALEIAVERGDASLAPARIADLALSFAGINKKKARPLSRAPGQG